MTSKMEAEAMRLVKEIEELEIEIDDAERNLRNSFLTDGEVRYNTMSIEANTRAVERKMKLLTIINKG
jgi:hypothetical protein